VTRIKKRRIKNLKKLSLKAIDAVDSAREENMEERAMKYYITQTGLEFLDEGHKKYKAGDYKKAEDEAAAKVIKRTEGKGHSPAKIGKRIGVATYWAGKEAIRRSTF